MIIVYHSNLLLPFFLVFFHYTLDLSKYSSVYLHIFIQKQNTVILYTAKSNRVPLLYPATLPHYLSITQVYFCFSTFFRHFMELLLLPSGKGLHSNCFIYFYTQTGTLSIRNLSVPVCRPVYILFLLYVFCLSGFYLFSDKHS